MTAQSRLEEAAEGARWLVRHNDARKEWITITHLNGSKKVRYIGEDGRTHPFDYKSITDARPLRLHEKALGYISRALWGDY